MEKGKRLNWIDTAKFIGIFLIYIAHYQGVAGHIYLFAFKFHVALFFFISGCTSYFESDLDLKNYILKKIRTLLIPFFVFGLMSVALYAVICHSGFTDIVLQLQELIKGAIRNSSFAAYSLWFLTCLFVIEICYRLLRYCKRWLRILIVCILFIGQAVYTGPRLPYNIDSIHYILYFSLGYELLPIVIKILSSRKKWILLPMACAYAAAEFFGFDIVELLPTSNRFITLLVSSLRSIVLILHVILIAKVIESILAFQKIGRNTLYLCGGEYLLKTILEKISNMIGQQIPGGMIECYIVTGVLLTIGTWVFAPPMKKAMRRETDDIHYSSCV